MDNPNTGIFTFCPACGQASLKASGVKSFACKDCGFSFFINCAAAAMALILDESDRLLVTTRKFDPGRGGLDLPGGFAEPGEGIEEALAREIKEELNLDLNGMDYFCSCFNAYPYDQVTYPVTDLAFVCHVADFSPLAASDDVEAVRFMPIQDLNPGQFAMASARQVVSRFKNKASGRPSRK
jgi:ADP-ribose pyrophosphatase YjhB (NUDIX family)